MRATVLGCFLLGPPYFVGQMEHLTAKCKAWYRQAIRFAMNLSRKAAEKEKRNTDRPESPEAVGASGDKRNSTPFIDTG